MGWGQKRKQQCVGLHCHQQARRRSGAAYGRSPRWGERRLAARLPSPCAQPPPCQSQRFVKAVLPLSDRSSCPRAPNAGSGDQIAVKDPNTSCSLPPAPRYNHTFSLRGPPSRPGAGPSSAGAAGAHLGPAVERTLALPPQLQGSAGRVRPRRIGARRGPLAPRHRLGTAARGPV